MSWLISKKLGTQIKMVIFIALMLFSVVLASVNYTQSSAVLVEQGVYDAQRQLDMLSEQLADQYEEYLKRAQQLNNILLDGYLPGVRKDGGVTEFAGARYHELASGGAPISNEFHRIDRFTRHSGAVATIFARTHDNDFIRITTSLKNGQGERAFGSLLGQSHPAYRQLLAGTDYKSVVSLFGKPYLTFYHPILEHGSVIGLSFVGLPLNTVMEDLFSSLERIVWGDTGYTIVLDGKEGSSQGTYLLHPKFDSKQNIKHLALPDGSRPFSNMFAQDRGVVSYAFEKQNGKVDTKHMAFTRIPHWDWVVMGGTFESELAKKSQTLLWSLVSQFLIGGVVIFIILTFYINRTFSPLTHLAGKLVLLGEGELTTTFDETRNAGTNEILRLENSASKMAATMRNTVMQAQQAATLGADNASAISQQAADVETHTRGVQHELSQMVSAVEQLTVSSQEIATQIETMSTQTHQVNALTQQGLNKLDTSIAGVRSVVSEQTQLNEQVVRLADQANNIRHVVSLIGEVAEQTNLLALNAAIEAARAGQAGRGFAVVADEVRGLAVKTQASISEIESIIVSLVKEVEHTSSGMTAVTTMSEKMMASLQLTQNDISAIGSEMNASAIQAQSISATTEEQAQATEAIAAQVSRVDTLNQHVDEVAKRSTNAANQLEESTERLSNVLGAFRT